MPQRKTAAEIGSLLARKNLTLATAESCTGGMIGAAITAIPGASRYYQGGVIAYDNAVKTTTLRVPRQILDSCGAVSRETALAMARGVRRLLGADCAVAVSGVAGPGGATRDKPVGTVWLAACVTTREKALVFRFEGSRQAVRRQATVKGLELLHAMLKKDLRRGAKGNRSQKCRAKSPL